MGCSARALDASDAAIVLIGPDWPTVAGADGRPRIADPGDFVQHEVAGALARDLRVVPVLVGGAAMHEAELPPALAALGRRNALEVSDTRWDYDVGRLVDVLSGVDRPS